MVMKALQGTPQIQQLGQFIYYDLQCILFSFVSVDLTKVGDDVELYEAVTSSMTHFTSDFSRRARDRGD